jgi:hypothetical protein
MNTLRAWLVGASVVLFASAAGAQTYTKSCTTTLRRGTNCTSVYTPPPKPFVPYDPVAEKRHPSASSEIVRSPSHASAPAVAPEHRPGCNFDNTICEK